MFGSGGRFPAATTLGAHVIHGAASQRLGHSLSRAGDFDGDKRDDLLVGSSPVLLAARAAGNAYVIVGRDSFPHSIEAANEIAIHGEKAGDTTGIAVTALGDLDKDGFADIAVGAVRGDGDEPGAGRVYFVRGRAGKSAIELGSETVVMRGKHTKDYLGEVLRGVDVDGDGYADLMISARGAAHGTTAAAGEIYVISGKGLGGQ